MKIDFESEDLHAPLNEINMTPMVDVMLVLLVILLITAPILNSSISLNLPKDRGLESKNQNPINISITKEGQYFLEQQSFKINELESHLKLIAQDNIGSQINIRADKQTEFEKISTILALSQKLGLTNISFITAPQ